MAAKKNEEMVVKTLPLLDDPNASQVEYFSLNFKGYTIERGVPVRIPKALADIIDASEEERRKGLAYTLKMALKEPTPTHV